MPDNEKMTEGHGLSLRAETQRACGEEKPGEAEH